MKRINIALVVIVTVLAVFALTRNGSEPMRAGDYVREYGGNHGTYAGILRETNCDRLPETWEVGLAMESRRGTGIADAALDRYDALGC